MSSPYSNEDRGTSGQVLLRPLAKALNYLISVINSQIADGRLPESKVLTMSRIIQPVGVRSVCKRLSELEPARLPAIVDLTFVGIWKGAAIFWVLPSQIAYVDGLEETWNFRLGLGPFKPTYRKFKSNLLSDMLILGEKIALPMASVELDCSSCDPEK